MRSDPHSGPFTHDERRRCDRAGARGLRRQTPPPDAILIVDNASTDGTLDRTFPEAVTIVRNPENLGTSGAVRAGLAHALEHGFDWAWLFDADPVPEPKSLEQLLAFFERLPPE
ncbi:MAG: glycosyltransferase [Methylocella sp.]